MMSGSQSICIIGIPSVNWESESVQEAVTKGVRRATKTLRKRFRASELPPTKVGTRFAADMAYRNLQERGLTTGCFETKNKPDIERGATISLTASGDPSYKIKVSWFRRLKSKRQLTSQLGLPVCDEKGNPVMVPCYKTFFKGHIL